MKCCNGNCPNDRDPKRFKYCSAECAAAVKKRDKRLYDKRRWQNGIAYQPVVSNLRNKLTTQDVVSIRAELSKGVRQVELAKRYQVTQPSINAIATGKTWHGVGEYTPPVKPQNKSRRAIALRRALKKHGLL